MAPKGVFSRDVLRRFADGKPMVEPVEQFTSLRRLRTSSLHSKESSVVPATAPICKRLRKGEDFHYVLHRQICGGISGEEAKEHRCSITAVASVKDNAADSITSESEAPPGPLAAR